MKKNIFILLAIVLFLSTEVFAVTSKQMGIIINLAGKQRMLTQKMSKEALLIKNGIEVKKNLQLLSDDAKLFDKTLNGLIGGEKTLKLVKVEASNIQNQLSLVKSLWQPFNNHIQNIIKKSSSSSDFEYISKNNVKLLKNMHKTVLLYVKQSQKVSKISVSLAEDINIAGRQRMLTQKISKDILQIASGIDIKASAEDLIKSKKLFNDSLNSLIKKSKLKNITKQLKKVQAIWSKVSPHIDAKNAGNKKTVKIIADALDKTRVQMNKAVKKYENSLKRQILAKSLSSIVGQLIQQKNLKGLVLNLSGKQRMLTQRMTKNALLIAIGIDKANSQKDLIFCANLYNQTLNGFIKGDKALKLTATKNPQIQAHLKVIQTKWQPFYKNAMSLAKNKKLDQNALKYMIGKNLEMLKLSHKLVQMYKNDTTGSKISPEMAEKVDLSGRQRMLSQKMLKEKLLIMYKINAKDNISRLAVDMKDFNIVLHDLIKGNKARNWSPEPISHIVEQLKIVKSLWSKFKPLLLSKDLSKKDLKNFNNLNMKLLKNMNKAVKMYEEASDIYDKKLMLKKQKPKHTVSV